MGNRQKVVVALSGGVDSAVAAGLLQDSGYDVSAATLHLRDDGIAETEEQLQQRYADAVQICRQLEIEHHLLDRRREFRQTVIEEFAAEYLQGRTPNPCVLCNREIKWRLLLKLVEELGADYLATGHYAGLRHSAAGVQLTRATHAAKDQTYMLWNLPVEQLQRTLFPLGDSSKEETRRQAARLNLEVADKEESQDICFVPDGDYGGFLRREFPAEMAEVRPGNLVDEAGNILGNHRGIPYYTIGQRKGLGIALGEPRFVSRIDPVTNSITISTGAALMQRKLTATRVNWLIPVPSTPFQAQARIRYHDRGAPCLVKPTGSDHMTVEFSEPRRAITPGQSVVLYDEDVLLGGGIIGESFE